jgi:hypothetical protein
MQFDECCPSRCLEGFVEIACHPRVSFQYFFAEHDDMHDREDLGALVVLCFHCWIVGKEARNCRIASEKSGGCPWGDERI